MIFGKNGILAKKRAPSWIYAWLLLKFAEKNFFLPFSSYLIYLEGNRGVPTLIPKKRHLCHPSTYMLQRRNYKHLIVRPLIISCNC